MKSIFFLLIILTFANVDSFPQRNRTPQGRGIESERKQRIERTIDNERNPVNNKQREIVNRQPELVSEPNYNFICRSGNGISIEGDVNIECTVIEPVEYEIIYNPYVPSFKELAIEKYEEGDFGGAIQLFTEAIKSNPLDSELRFLRGKAYMEIGDNVSAKNDFSIVNVLEPSFADAYYYRALSNLYLGYEYLAVEDFRQAASLGDSLAEKYLREYSN